MDIVLDGRAQRQLKRTPKQIVRKLRDWVLRVSTYGLREVAKIPGYHDEPLSGERKGQRSIRLSRLWRAIYHLVPQRLTITTVTPHEYRVHGATEVDALDYLNRLLAEAAANDQCVVEALCRAGRADLARAYRGSR
jgi:proteic killer suppression protein